MEAGELIIKITDLLRDKRWLRKILNDSFQNFYFRIFKIYTYIVKILTILWVSIEF